MNHLKDDLAIILGCVVAVILYLSGWFGGPHHIYLPPIRVAEVPVAQVPVVEKPVTHADAYRALSARTWQVLKPEENGIVAITPQTCLIPYHGFIRLKTSTLTDGVPYWLVEYQPTLGEVRELPTLVPYCTAGMQQSLSVTELNTFYVAAATPVLK